MMHTGDNLLRRRADARKRVFIKTFGCQMNDHDTQKITALLVDEGYARTAVMDEADLILFNTCTIREKARNKALSDIGRTAQLKNARPDLLIGVCGCVAQQDQEALHARFPHLDLLFGPDQIGMLPQLLRAPRKPAEPTTAFALVNDVDDYDFVALIPWGKDDSPATAFVTIMKGCDANCAYCIVPRVRGKEVCRPADAIVAEVAALADVGVKEVTLLGQTVNTYGNRRHAGVCTFPELLARLASETNITRIRFTSPHPKDVTRELAQALAVNPKLPPHIHLPLQAGADRVLRAMRRSYSQATYLDRVEMLRNAVPDIAITTDLIVGFPGETEDDFAETLRMVEHVGFDGMYAFKYSPRPGTTAAEGMVDDVPEVAKADRLARLLALGNDITRAKLTSEIGRTASVIIDSERDGQWHGRTPKNQAIFFAGDDCCVGDVVDVEVTNALGHSLVGVVTDCADVLMC